MTGIHIEIFLMILKYILGPFCKNRHRRRVLCPNYLAGFCLEGHLCKYAHPSFNIPPLDASALLRTRGHYNMGIICHNCHERGHKVRFFDVLLFLNYNKFFILF